MTDEKNLVIKLSDWIVDNYQNNPTIRLLLPVVAAMTGVATGDVMTGALAGGAIASLAEGLNFAVSKIHQERFKTLIDEKDLWEAFSKKLPEKFQDEGVLHHTIMRLEGIGLYQTVGTGLLFGGSTPITGRTTPLFKDFAEWISGYR